MIWRRLGYSVGAVTLLMVWLYVMITVPIELSIFIFMLLFGVFYVVVAGLMFHDSFTRWWEWVTGK